MRLILAEGPGYRLAEHATVLKEASSRSYTFWGQGGGQLLSPRQPEASVSVEVNCIVGYVADPGSKV